MSIPVLVVDDSSLLRTILIRLLPEDKGLEITQANSGDEMLELLKANEYQVIFLDLHMPGTDGFQVLETLQGADKDYNIIAASADFQPGAQERALNLGAKGFVKKPFDKAEIDETLSKLNIL
mgnify:CR=1 FL=1